MSPSFRSLRLFAIFAGLCLIVPSPFAGAQTTNGDGGDGVEQSQQPLTDLKAALPFVKWDARTHGPLIAIAPEKVTWPVPVVSHDIDAAVAAAQANHDMGDQDPLMPPKDKYGLSADRVAKHFGRRLMRYQTMAIYVPPTMIVLNADLKPANPLLGASTEDKLRRLGATLTDAQWALLGSAQGLGFGDMSKEQQPLFDDVLPEKMTLQQSIVKQSDNGYIGSETIDDSGKTLNPGQRAGVRLHLTRQASFGLMDAKNEPLPLSSPFHSDVIGARKTVLAGEEETLALRSTLFGQAVRYEAPNTLKRSDLDLKQPLLQDTYVPLTGVKTVGDLLRAAQKATGLELHADNRLARLPVYVSTQARLVHASDLLEALCWALTATYRQVGPVPGGDPKDFAFVLTYDRVGLAVTRGQITAWSRRGQALREQNNGHFDEAIQKQKPGKYMQYTKGDPLAPTDDALQALQSAKQVQASRVYDEDNPSVQYEGGQDTVPFTALTAEQRQQMTEGLKQVDKMHTSDPNFPTARTDRVRMWTSFGLSYLVPGGGEIGSESTLYGDDELDAEDPEIARRRADAQKVQEQNEYRKQIVLLKQGAVSVSQAFLCIAPKTVEAAEPVLAAARGLGFSSVWIEVPDSSPGLKLLAGCVAAGKAHGVPVGARVSLIHVAPAKIQANPGIEDINVYGETGSEWAADARQKLEGIDEGNYQWQELQHLDKQDALAPEATEARRRLAAWLQDVTAIPGLAGVALNEAANPGHDWSAETHDDVKWAGTTFGYTVANRLAFLRDKGYDPIDFDERTDEYDDWELRTATKLPRFDTRGEEDIVGYYEQNENPDKPGETWSAFRRKSEIDFLMSLHDSVAKNHPSLPIYLAGYDGNGYEEWKAGGRPPFAPPLVAPPTKKPLLSVPPPAATTNDMLLSLSIAHDFLSDSDDQTKEMEKLDPGVKGLAPSAFVAAYIRESLRSSGEEMIVTNGTIKKLTKPGPKGIVLDETNLTPIEILTLLKGVLAPVGK